MSDFANQRVIDKTVSAPVPESHFVDGLLIAQQGQGLNTWVAAQVYRVDPANEDDYEVHLEQAIVPEYGGPRFQTLGIFDQTTGGQKVQNFPANTGSRYRFRHLSGPSCRVLLK